MTDIKKIVVETSFIQKGLNAYNKNMRSLNASFSAPLDKMKDMQTAQGGWNRATTAGSTQIGRMGLGLRKTTHGMRGFRMEMLGIMFFGMAMKKMFGGLLKTSLGWTGIMELLSMTLGVLFLPVALQLLDIFLPLFEWLMNLSDNTKLWIGWLVVLGFIIGTIIMVVGMLALGIGSIILVIGPVIGAIAAFALIFVGMGIIVWGIIAIFKNWGKSTSGVIKGVGLVLIGLGIILFLFIGWWALIPIAIGLAIAIIAGNWAWFRDFFIILWDTLKNAIKVAWVIIMNIIKFAWNTIVQLIQDNINSIIKLINLMIKAMNFIPGVNVPLIPEIDLSFVKAELKDATALALELQAATNFKAAQLEAARYAQKLAKEAEKANVPAAGIDSFTGDLNPQNFKLGDDIGSNGNKDSETLEPTNITNNFFGFTTDDLKKELDSRDSEMASQMERNR